MGRQFLSGDNVEVTPHVTIKWGGSHLAAQADVMCRVNNHWQRQDMPPLAPVVHHTWTNGYVMETMAQKIGRFDWRSVIAKLRPLWRCTEADLHQVQPRFSFHTLQRFLEEQQSPLLQVLPSRVEFIRHYAEANEMTHGDCTTDNVMRDGFGRLRLIDWAPERRAFVPPHHSVDLGKLAQSLIGTFDPYSLDSMRFRREIDAVFSFHPHVWLWTAVHFERIRKRVQNHIDDSTSTALDHMLRMQCVTAVRFCINWRSTHA